jgi:hypothetical protein
MKDRMLGQDSGSDGNDMETRKVKKRQGRRMKRPPPLPISYNELGIDEKRKVLYRNFHEVSDVVYLIEISRSKTKVFIVLFENYANPDGFIAEALTEKLAFSLMSRHGNLYENFVKSFNVAYGKLLIDGYHKKVIEQRARQSPRVQNKNDGIQV